MGEIFVVVEHRKGEVREITYQMLHKADQLCRELSDDLTAIVMGGKDDVPLNEVAKRADRVIAVEDERVKDFNADLYKETLKELIEEHRPLLTLMAHSAYGMDLAPSLSIQTGYPLATDCVDVLIEDGRLKVLRQIYAGKLFSKVSFKDSKGYLITVREGAFPPEAGGKRRGELTRQGLPADLPEPRKQFVAFEDAGAGEVDISQAELLVSVGRGIGEKENVAILEELAERMGGTLSCSRPVVDKNWLPKYHQVGTSGKTVKPRVYLAFGISGAFQHIAGIAGAGTVIAVNKDKKAPIFRVADYGVTEDLFKIVEALKTELAK